MPDVTPSQARELAETFEKDRPSLPMTYIRELAAAALRSLADQVEKLRALDKEYGRVETAIIFADGAFDGDSDHDNCGDRLIASVQRLKSERDERTRLVETLQHTISGVTADAVKACDRMRAKVAAVTKERDALREALRCLEETCDAVAATRTPTTYEAILKDAGCELLIVLDEARREARAALKETDQ